MKSKELHKPSSSGEEALFEINLIKQLHRTMHDMEEQCGQGYSVGHGTFFYPQYLK